MNISRTLCLLMTCLTFQSAHSATFQDLDALREQVEIRVAEHLSEIYGKREVEKNIDIQVANLDSRLRLAACDHHIELDIQNTSHGSRNVSVKARCVTGTKWAIYVPVSLDVYREVAVTSQNLDRGQRIDEDQLSFQRVNTSRISHNFVDSLSDVVGMELKRPLQAGSVVKRSDLRMPDLVRKGDAVEVHYKDRFVTVSATGTALSDGHMGQRIKIKNERSRRVIDALVTGPGIAEVH